MLAVEEPKLAISKPPEAPKPVRWTRTWPVIYLAALGFLLFGIGLRIWLPVGFQGAGFDELLYRKYVLSLEQTGILDYDTVTENFLREQRQPNSICKLPPTRFLYVYCGWIWKRIQFGDAPPLDVRQQANVARDP